MQTKAYEILHYISFGFTPLIGEEVTGRVLGGYHEFSCFNSQGQILKARWDEMRWRETASYYRFVGLDCPLLLFSNCFVSVDLTPYYLN